ncbi:MAG TPA: hypothetical protein VF401_00195 [Candidatus Saccharimonadales bacterium]
MPFRPEQSNNRAQRRREIHLGREVVGNPESPARFRMSELLRVHVEGEVADAMTAYGTDTLGAEFLCFSPKSPREKVTESAKAIAQALNSITLRDPGNFHDLAAINEVFGPQEITAIMFTATAPPEEVTEMSSLAMQRFNEVAAANGMTTRLPEASQREIDLT